MKNSVLLLAFLMTFSVSYSSEQKSNNMRPFTNIYMLSPHCSCGNFTKELVERIALERNCAAEVALEEMKKNMVLSHPLMFIGVFGLGALTYKLISSYQSK